MKLCSKCHIWKRETAQHFSRQKLGKNGFRASCKACDAKYHQANKDSARIARLERRRKDPKSVSERHRIERYGCDPHEYNAYFVEQRGRCGICGKHAEECAKGLHLDHDHDTGKARGLLCLPCNMHLGRYGRRKRFEKESETWLMR